MEVAHQVEAEQEEDGRKSIDKEKEHEERGNCNAAYLFDMSLPNIDKKKIIHYIIRLLMCRS